MANAMVKRLLKIYRTQGLGGIGRAIFRFVKHQVECAFMRLEARLHHIWLRKNFGRGVPGPHHTIEIDPQQIDTLLFGFSFEKHRTYIRDGEWDRRYCDEEIGLYGYEHHISEPTLFSYNRYILAESMREHFVGGKPWTETRLHDYLKQHQNTVEENSGNYSDVFERLRTIDELYDDIRNSGYQTRKMRQLISLPLIGCPPSAREIKVAITRDGEIVFVDGRHRFVIARLLGYKRIPAKVVLRHHDWMKIRNEIARGFSNSLTEDTMRRTRDHPDLQDIARK